MLADTALCTGHIWMSRALASSLLPTVVVSRTRPAHMASQRPGLYSVLAVLSATLSAILAAPIGPPGSAGGPLQRWASRHQSRRLCQVSPWHPALWRGPSCSTTWSPVSARTMAFKSALGAEQLSPAVHAAAVKPPALLGCPALGPLCPVISHWHPVQQ